MKLPIAVVAAICSTIIAAPIHSPLPEVGNGLPQPIPVPSDLTFYLPPTDEIFAKDYMPPLVTTTVDFRAAVIDPGSDSSAVATESQAPEPFPLSAILMGVILVGTFAALYRMLAEKRSRRRRRTRVRMRALIAER